MFAGKTWWITGASSGIGMALAEALAKDGAKLILSGRNVEALNEVATRVGGETLVLPFEATDYERIPALVEQAWAWSGRVDGLVNNAGIRSVRSLSIRCLRFIRRSSPSICWRRSLWRRRYCRA